MIPPMRTGFDPVASTQPLEITPLHIKLISLVMMLLEYAITSAAAFVEHQGRTIIAPDDIKRAIKKEAMTFFDRDDLEERLDEICRSITVDVDEREVRATIGEDDGNDDANDDGNDAGNDADDEDEDDTNDEDEWGGITIVDESEVKEEHPTRICECQQCVRMTTVHEDWDRWDVEGDEVKAFLKQQVDQVNDDFQARQHH